MTALRLVVYQILFTVFGVLTMMSTVAIFPGARPMGMDLAAFMAILYGMISGFAVSRFLRGARHCE